MSSPHKTPNKLRTADCELKANVLTFGTFDLLHPGHRWFLRTAKKYGQKLYVILARDVNVKKLKRHLPTQNERVRLAAVHKLPYVTHAELGAMNLNQRYDAIVRINPDYICLGYDQKYLTTTLAHDLKRLKLKTKIVRLKSYHPEKYKSSIIKIRNQKLEIRKKF
jgi:FAD synthetase